MSRIVVNGKVRSLLYDLDNVMQKFHVATRTLADRNLDLTKALDVGADRELLRTQIVGIAWQIHKASTGQRE
jgi:hypothetical protein